MCQILIRYSVAHLNHTECIALNFAGTSLIMYQQTHLSGPLCALLLGGVPLGDVLALLLLDVFALNDVILDVVLVISCNGDRENHDIQLYTG